MPDETEETPARKVLLVTVAPVPAEKVRSGDRVKVSYYEPTGRVSGVRLTTVGGRECYEVGIVYGSDRYEVYLGAKHTLWRVTDERFE